VVTDDQLAAADSNDGPGLLDVALPLAQSWKLLAFGSLLVGLLALAVSFVVPQWFTSRTSILPPQPPQSAAMTAIAQLGALSGLAGAATGMKTPADQYVALLQSTTIADRLIDAFKLMEVYDAEYREEARKELARNVRITAGRKDGLISIEVEDTQAQRAADMANRYVEELRRLAGQLVLTEAQQRRVFFEDQLKKTRDRLTAAQQVLQSSGFSQGALRSDARASAEGYARLAAEATAADVRLQTLRSNLADTTPEVQQAASLVAALRAQLARLERPNDVSGNQDYVSKYRELKYQETLFELLARQYELARLDESREGSLIQVVDEAKPAERKSWPKRGLVAVAASLLAFLLIVIFVLTRAAWRQASGRPETAAKMASLRVAAGRRNQVKTL
jgi:uncharacterized protein involved in exopolysaccharide biosynthesis